MLTFSSKLFSRLHELKYALEDCVRIDRSVIEIREASVLEDESILYYLTNLSTVVSVGAVDEFIKMSSIDLLTCFLSGMTQEHYAPKKFIPAGWLAISRDLTREDGISVMQDQTLLYYQVWKEFERMNFQAADHVKKQLKELNLGSLKSIVGKRDDAAFSESLDRLANRRHEIVHRLGRKFNPLFGSSYPEKTEPPATEDLEIIFSVCKAINQKMTNLIKEDYIYENCYNDENVSLNI